MIFTSYFAKIRKFPENFIPVSISQWPPRGYVGAEFKELAPTKEILTTWKNNHEKDEAYWNGWYDLKYQKDVLGKLKSYEMVDKLVNLLPDDVKNLTNIYPIWENPNINIVLVCFEKSSDFCHRQLVSEWLNNNHIKCKEATEEDFEKYGKELSIIKEMITDRDEF